MPIDLDSRRSIRKIAREDFDAYPVWEWALNEEQTHGHGESFVRPTGLTSLSPLLASHYIVGATATLSDGSTLPACAEVSVRAKKLRIEPMFLFLQDRHLDFGGEETRTVLSHYLKRADARPVSWKLAVPLDGEAAPPKGAVRRSLAERLAQAWKRLGAAAHRKSVLVP
ncbi:MAG: hypothetical protein V4631_19610 [Pseudomonadota bacterium]